MIYRRNLINHINVLKEQRDLIHQQISNLRPEENTEASLFLYFSRWVRLTRRYDLLDNKIFKLKKQLEELAF